MDLVLGQSPAVAAAASAANAANSATTAANSASAAAGSAAAAAASAASISTPGNSITNLAGKLEVAMPVKFAGGNYTVTTADRGWLINATAAITVTLPTGATAGDRLHWRYEASNLTWINRKSPYPHASLVWPDSVVAVFKAAPYATK